jgi:hypothetical protein
MTLLHFYLAAGVLAFVIIIAVIIGEEINKK